MARQEALTVCFASAGAGKTYLLSRTYLTLALSSHSGYFKHLIALTFTNKATEQMRMAIFQRLEQFKVQEGDIAEVAKDLKVSTVVLAARADRLMKRLLHQYSYFQVRTIDSFFIHVLHAFMLELNFSGNYAPELDTEIAFRLITDRLLARINHPDYRVQTRWLLRFARSQVAENRSFASLEDGLLSFSRGIVSESFKKKYQPITADSLAAFEGRVQKIKQAYTDDLDICAKEAGVLLELYSLGDQVLNVRGGAYALLKKIMDKDYPITLGKVQQREADDLGLWVTKKLLKEDPAIEEQLSACLVEGLAAVFARVQDVVQQCGVAYNTANLVDRGLYQLGLVEYYLANLRAYRAQEQLFFIADIPDLLCRVVQADTPLYVYEKIGTRLNHYLLDEFQDISLLQWGVLAPLLHEGLSQGHENLMVGDAKQSIYRWRGADSKDLFEAVNSDLKQYISSNERVYNWRSLAGIVFFNNNFFQQSFRYTQEHFPQHQDTLGKLWTSVQQEPQQGQGGYVWVLKQEERDLAWLLDKITLLLDQGYAMDDIAILARSNKELAEITQALMTYNTDWRVYSEEALLLKNSLAVQLVITAMRYLCYGESLHEEAFDYLAQGKAFGLSELREQGDLWRRLSLYELGEALVHVLDLEQDSTQRLYIHQLLSLLFEHQNKPGSYLNSFLELWENKQDSWSIGASQKHNAMTVLTIHQSKGMEFEVVLLPFVDWKLNHAVRGVHWWEAPKTPLFEEIPCFPLTYSSALANTDFADAYASERFLAFVDNLNILYVAFTRAKQALYMAFVHKEKVGDPSSENFTAGSLVQTVLFPDTEDSAKEGFETSAYGTVYSDGGLPAASTRSDQVHSVAVDLSYQRFGVRESYPFAVTPNLSAELGIYVHGVLADLRSYADFKQKYVTFQTLTGRSEVAIQAYDLLQRVFELPEMQAWYDGSYRLLAEQEVLLQETHRRIDLIAIRDDRVHVIDFKTSDLSLSAAADVKQVQAYLEMLGDMMPSVSLRGFLVYLDTCRVKPVAHE